MMNQCVPCTDQRPNACDHCTMHCLTKQDLTRHLADKHEIGVVLYRCCEPGCTHKSKRKGNLKRHVKNRHGIPDVFVCDHVDEDDVECTKVCKTKADLEDHTRVFHKMGPWLHCDECDYRTRARGNLRQHKANMHDINVTWYGCDRPGCSMKFKYLSHMKAHRNATH